MRLNSSSGPEARLPGALAALAIALAAGACALLGGDRGASGGERIRAPFDPIGYTHSAEGIDAVVSYAEGLEGERLARNRTELGLDDQTAFTAAISPHDDYLYAERVYVHLYPFLRARDLILIGVAHHARERPACEGKLVFDSFDAWHGPYGDVSISPLRAALLGALPPGDVLVDDELHAGEHSLEGMIPFLQHYQRGARIVPILVPYMSWERLAELAGDLSAALATQLAERGWKLGPDAAILISSDSVHYGDEGWGGRSYADFGTSGTGYDRAVARDCELIARHLSGELSMAGLEGFYHAVLAEDFHRYRISWCGRFSIPFGLATLIGLHERLGLAVPRGALLRYGTTLDPGRGDPGVAGLGVTAPANLHHWVGFAAIGYR